MNLLNFLRFAPFSTLETKGESAICVQFRTWLTEQELTNRCIATWRHNQNESNQKTGASWRFWNLQRNMGKFAGIPDYTFLWKNGGLELEIKDGKKGKQSDAQKDYETWCRKKEVPYEIAKSVDEAISIVKKYGIVI